MQQAAQDVLSSLLASCCRYRLHVLPCAFALQLCSCCIPSFLAVLHSCCSNCLPVRSCSCFAALIQTSLVWHWLFSSRSSGYAVSRPPQSGAYGWRRSPQFCGCSYQGQGFSTTVLAGTSRSCNKLLPSQFGQQSSMLTANANCFLPSVVLV